MADFLAGPITDPLPQRLTPASATLVDAATVTIDASVADVFVLTLGGNRTLAAPTNSKGGQIITLIVKQSVGMNTLAFDAAYKGVSTFQLKSGAGETTVFSFVCQPASGGFEYLCVGVSTAAGQINFPLLPIASGSSAATVPVGAALDGKPVLVSLNSNVGAVAAAAAILKGAVTGGNLVVTLVNVTTGAPINAGSNLVVSAAILAG